MPVAVLFSGLIAFFSGLLSLGLELIWFRYLQLVFGNAVYATAAVTAFFMLGMAAGNAFWGRLADRTDNPSSLLRVLLIGLALFCVVSPAVYRFVAYLTLPAAIPAADAVRIVVIMVVGGGALAVPAFLTGGVVPVLVTMRCTNRTPAADVGLLYGLYTLGGAAGALLSAFLLMPLLGLRGSLLCIGAMQLALLLLIRRPSGGKRPDQPYTVEYTAEEDCRIGKRMLLFLFAVSGCTALSYEVLWSRILLLFFRNSLYDFALLLSATLTGMVIGSLWCGRRVHRIRRPVVLFAVLQMAIGGAAALSLMLVHTFPYTLSMLQSMSDLQETFGTRFWLAGNGFRFLAAFLTVAPQAVLFGATFPLVSRVLLVRSQTGEDFGRASALNGIGSAIGSLTAGFVLIALFGISGGIRITSFVNIAVGSILLLFCSLRRTAKKTVMVGVACLGVFIVVIAAPRWDKLSMSQLLLDPRQNLSELLDLLYYHEDASGMVSVVRFKPSGTKYLYTDRLFGQNSSAMNGPEDHRRLGYIPAMLHGGAHSALVIGLGAGITLRGVAEAGVETITCVEVSKNICRAAGYFDEVNRGVLQNPAVRIVNRDGRAYLASAADSYDVIIGDIFFPVSSGSGMVYSREFFELCRNRLSPDGVYCQWLPLHQLSPRELRIVVATFRSVFPDAQLWYGMIGSNTPVVGCVGCRSGTLRIDFERLTRYFADPARNVALCEIDLCDPMVFLSNFIASGTAVNEFCTGAVCNTDDKPVIEFLNPRVSDSFKERRRKNMETLRRIQVNVFETGTVR